MQASSDTQKSVTQTPNDASAQHGLSSNVAICDKKLSSDKDKSIHETSSNQNKADYKVAENR